MVLLLKIKCRAGTSVSNSDEDSFLELYRKRKKTGEMEIAQSCLEAGDLSGNFWHSLVQFK